LARATCGTIRTRHFNIGALIRVSVRRVVVSLSSAYPLQELFSAGRAALAGTRFGLSGPPRRPPKHPAPGVGFPTPRIKGEKL